MNHQELTSVVLECIHCGKWCTIPKKSFMLSDNFKKIKKSKDKTLKLWCSCKNSNTKHKITGLHHESVIPCNLKDII